MGQRLKALLAWGTFLLCAPLAVSSGTKQVSAIDQLCRDIIAEFPNGPSLAFYGPDPWSEIDAPPIELTEGSWAYVYAEGPGIRWLFLREIGARASWLQDTHYFYRVDGTLAKRQRSLMAFRRNIGLVVTGYYDPSGRLLKEITRHHPLTGKHENTDEFVDHEPPLYPTSADVPFSDDPELARRLTRAIPIRANPQSPSAVDMVFSPSKKNCFWPSRVFHQPSGS